MFVFCNAHIELSLLIRAGEFWHVYEEVGKKTGWMAAKVVSKEDQLMPPVNGWLYARDGKFESDPTLVCSREVSPVCKEVRIESVAVSLFIHLVDLHIQNNNETSRL